MGKTAGKWNKLPKGWTDESVRKFWETMTGDVKHKVTKCMKKMEGKVDNTGAFCGSLADKIDGSTDWRKGPRGPRKKKTSSAQRVAATWACRVGSRDIQALNKFNPTELVGALLTALSKQGLRSVADRIRQLGIPKLVNDAWMGKKGLTGLTSEQEQVWYGGRG